MQPRSLDQVISSLGSIYDPQVQSVQQQQAALPGQVASEEQGLQAKQQTAFGDILNGARSRGVGVAFGGIPLSDQARYTADNYLPALANLHTAQKQQQQSLSDAINAINERRATQGQSIYEGERNFAEQQRQFNETLAQQRASAQAAAAAAANPSFGFGGGGQAPNQPAGAADPYGNIDKGSAMKSIQALMNTNDPARINREYNAIKASAGYGNVFDQYKLGLLNSFSTPSKTAAYDPRYANLLKQSLSYKAPAPSKPVFNTGKAVTGALPFLSSNPLGALASGALQGFWR